MKRFIDKQLPGFNFKSYLVQKYQGFWPEWMPSQKELQMERSTIMQLVDKWQKKKELDQWKMKRAKYNKVMKEWSKLQK